MAAAQEYTFACLAYGDKSVQKVLSITVPSDKTVGYLKSAVLPKALAPSQGYMYKACDLWKVSIPGNDDAIASLVLEDNPEAGIRLLSPMERLEVVFPDPPEYHVIHIVITGLEGNEDDDIAKALHKVFHSTILKAAAARTPSENAKSENYRTYQWDDYPIYDGGHIPGNPREFEPKAPPIQLYHPAFAHFLDDIANESLQVPLEMTLATVNLMHAASGLYHSEDDREAAIRQPLKTFIPWEMVKIINLDRLKPDAVVLEKMDGDIRRRAALLIREDKNDFGDGACDPSIQAGLSFSQFYTHGQPRRNGILDHTCCPVFLLASAGPWFSILGGIFTSKVIVQRLTDFLWIADDTALNDARISYIARVFFSLRRGMTNLHDYYQSIQPYAAIQAGVHPRYFPSPTVFIDNITGATIEFTYIKPLGDHSTCVTFLAQTTEPRPRRIVVKFVQRYNQEAHQLLAEARMAPKLFYCGKIGVLDTAPTYGRLQMVVMEFLPGYTLDNCQLVSPSTLATTLRAIVKLLHDNDYVFGDLREPNIMICRATVMLIDFDWAGKAGLTLYPPMISPRIQWPQRVEGGSVMKKEHDETMLNNLLQRYTATFGR